jgi:hypothetical protein
MYARKQRLQLCVLCGVDGQTEICFDRSVLQAPNESYLQTIFKKMKEKIDYLPFENAKKH